MKTKKTLVIGASLKPQRYSNLAITRLVANKHEVVAIGLKEGFIAGIKIDTGLPNYKDINTVTIYLNPERQKEYYDYVIGLNPERVIFNPGTENMQFEKLLIKNNILIEDACTLVLLSTNQY